MQDFRMETFLEVCRQMSFTKAAGSLCMTQPAVTQHIHHIEEEYGVALFVREGRRIRLTPEGETLRRAALTMKHDEARLKDELHRLGSRRSFIFGATLSVAEFMLVDGLARFIGMHEGDRIELKVANTEDLFARLDSGGIDFAIVEGDVPRDRYSSILYGRESYVAVASPRDAQRLAGTDFNGLLGEKLVTREEGSGTRTILEHEMGRRGLALSDFSSVVELGSIGLIKRLVERGAGITFVYRAAVADEIEAGTLAVIPVRGFELTHGINFIFRKDSIFQDEYEGVFAELKGR